MVLVALTTTYEIDDIEPLSLMEAWIQMIKDIGWNPWVNKFIPLKIITFGN